jgi:hypothetical protein
MTLWPLMRMLSTRARTDVIAGPSVSSARMTRLYPSKTSQPRVDYEPVMTCSLRALLLQGPGGHETGLTQAEDVIEGQRLLAFGWCFVTDVAMHGWREMV